MFPGRSRSARSPKFQAVQNSSLPPCRKGTSKCLPSFERSRRSRDLNVCGSKHGCGIAKPKRSELEDAPHARLRQFGEGSIGINPVFRAKVLQGKTLGGELSKPVPEVTQLIRGQGKAGGLAMTAELLKQIAHALKRFK